MDFELTEDQRLLRDTARSFADSYLAPRAAAIDSEGRFPLEEFRECARLGFTGMLIPEAYGGSDIGTLGMVLVMEEVNRACASTGVTLSVHVSLATSVIVAHGTEEQKRRFLPAMSRGEVMGAYALSEPNAGSDAASLATSARRDGDHYVLSGTKAWITSGGHADLYLVYATLDRSLKARGITAFLVEKGTPGFSFGKFEKKLGILGSSTTGLFFDECRVPAANRLGAEGEGFRIAMHTLDGGRIGIAAQALGIGRACLEASIGYAGQRVQFGRPIGAFQAIQWKIADMAMELDAARLLVHRAAWLKDRALPHTQEASMAKLFASETANRCAREAVQIHGGVGYTKAFPVERHFRDAKITEIYEGTSQVQRIVISRALLRG